MACFNTQPPEGGWSIATFAATCPFCFNTQPPEGGWRVSSSFLSCSVSTHSRPKAAGTATVGQPTGRKRFNTQPPEGGWLHYFPDLGYLQEFQHTAARRRLASALAALAACCCFNTQPPEGGWCFVFEFLFHIGVSTHSRPKAAGTLERLQTATSFRFQHTAARRRLDTQPLKRLIYYSFQHTAARRRLGQHGNLILIA